MFSLGCVLRRLFAEDLKDEKQNGDIKHVIGWNVTPAKDRVTISQEHYIARIVERYGMKDCNPAKTPALKSQEIRGDPEEETTDFPYREAMGSLLYLVK